MLEALPPAQRSAVWGTVKIERAGKALTYLHDEIRSHLARQLDIDDLVATAQNLELDDPVDLIQSLRVELSCALIQTTSPSRRE